MENRHKRLKEIREKHDNTQQDLAAVLGKDVTRMSRYEKGKGAKTMPAFMKKGLSDLFTKEEIAYIDTGVDILLRNECVNDAGVLYNGEDDHKLHVDIDVIVDLLKEMDIKQRRSVLRYALEVLEGDRQN